MNPPPGARLQVEPDDRDKPWRGSSLHLLVGEKDVVLDESFLRAEGTSLSVCWDSVREEWPDLWETPARAVVGPTPSPPEESP